MLLETQRRRKRALTAITAPSIVRQQRRAPTPTPTPTPIMPSTLVEAPSRRPRPRPRPEGVIAAAYGDEVNGQEHLPPPVVNTTEPLRMYQTRSDPAISTAPRTSTGRLADRRLLLSRANRMQLMLLERLRSVDIRRSRRVELLEEITRLKKVMQELQDEVDATTRNLESLEQLVQHLQRISFPGISAVSTTQASAARARLLPLAPGTVLWANPALLAGDSIGGDGGPKKDEELRPQNHSENRNESPS